MRLASSLAALLAAFAALPAHAADEYGPASLIAAAEKEGKVVLYTAAFSENEIQQTKAFNKRFPKVQVEMVRAPGGQLITRIQSESAAGKLNADVIDYSDRTEIARMDDLFMDYAPPNAAQFAADAQISKKLWPRTVGGWCISYNEALVQDPPKSWKDLLDPKWKGKIGEVIAASGGTTWTRVMYERQVIGENYWADLAKNAVQLYPSSAPLSDAVVRGEVPVGPVISSLVYTKSAEGAPIKCSYPTDGIPLTPQAAGIPKAAPHPNAAKLFMNWGLSLEGQTYLVKTIGNYSMLKNGPVPDGIDPKLIKFWVPDPKQYDALKAEWIEAWNKTFNYRQ
jgi:iron(III) transport system substrate-binding protein